MKKVLSVFVIAATVVACTNKAEKTAQAKLDSINVAQAREKAMKDSLRLDSFQKEEIARKERAEQQRIAAATAASQRRTYVKSYSESGTNAQPAAAQKKGWSSAAKGAVIGGVVGAGTGILVDKKDARGAIIGGVVGAGTGYAIGRGRDKKSGRVQD